MPLPTLSELEKPVSHYFPTPENVTSVQLAVERQGAVCTNSPQPPPYRRFQKRAGQGSASVFLFSNLPAWSVSDYTGTGGHVILNPALNSLAITQPQTQLPTIPTCKAGTLGSLGEGAKNGASFPTLLWCRTARCFLWTHVQGDFLHDCSSVTAL